MPKKKLLITILAFICIICLLPITSSAAKTIKLEKGKTYKLKIKKGSTVKLSNKKVLKVNKKGKVIALKPGKCTVKVVTKNKVKKYRFNVVKPQNEEVKPTETPKPTEAPRFDGGIFTRGPYIIKDIISIDEKSSYVDLSFDEKNYHYLVDAEDIANGVDTIRIVVSNSDIDKKQYKVGSEMTLLYYSGRYEKNIVGNICNITQGAHIY